MRQSRKQDPCTRSVGVKGVRSEGELTEFILEKMIAKEMTIMSIASKKTIARKMTITKLAAVSTRSPRQNRQGSPTNHGTGYQRAQCHASSTPFMVSSVCVKARGREDMHRKVLDK